MALEDKNGDDNGEGRRCLQEGELIVVRCLLPILSYATDTYIGVGLGRVLSDSFPTSASQTALPEARMIVVRKTVDWHRMSVSFPTLAFLAGARPYVLLGRNKNPGGCRWLWAALVLECRRRPLLRFSATRAKSHGRIASSPSST